MDDASNGILRFTVNDDGNNSILFHSNPEKGIDDTKTLYSNDKVIIDYKGCDVIFKTITEYDFTNGGYTIEFTGEANSVSINGSTVPEFPASLILWFAILAAIGFALLLKKKATVSNKKNNGEKVESRKIKCKTINHFFFGQPC